ncbi:orotate phosphoribosyltransferase [Fomitiporia mediterranea MF3/22]|uniref:orotate phosphoribosyltransferase n=1 Tax=Fomitiporia mediterranea (strain MF3/22) TaxID=694068 RepID=UPI0004409482|nr:orotate phosphoribosyltransferase [Fomitiporia mediterranea MF3/22]EJD05510.1 orotate phosphoribosyltransferase [Fomitiporia mediterranea MF3/22]
MASSSPAELQQYQKDIIEGAMSVGALKFGSFTLKSGRTSPYFVNAGLLSTGPLISAVASGYAALIAQQKIPFDVLFGPAYKGIPFVAATSLTLNREHGISVGYAYDRKEAKEHGEGGRMIGSDVRGKRVLILDDVMTAGTAIRQSIDLIRREGGTVVGVVTLLDREEVTIDGRNTVRDVEGILGEGRKVSTILRMRDLMTWLENNGQTDVVQRMKAYRDEYGVKD